MLNRIVITKTKIIISIILIALASVSLIISYFHDPSAWWGNALLNLGTEILGIFLTVAIIDVLIQWSLERQLRQEKRIRFSSLLHKASLSPTESDKSGFRYRFKIENASKGNIIDLELTARLSVKGLKNPSIWNTLDIPLNEDGEASYRIPLIKPAKEGVAKNRKILFLHPNSAERLQTWNVFPDAIREKALQRKILLEDLLDLGSDAKLEIFAIGYDEFSEGRKLSASPEYRLKNVSEKKFDSKSLDVVNSES